MPDAPPQDAIDLPHFADIVAHLRHFPEDRGDEVLARLGVEQPAWRAASARWWTARDAELARGATEITRRFGAAFARTRKRLEAEKPALESLGRLVDAPPAPAPAPPPEPAPPRVEPVVPLAAPSFVLAAHRLAGTVVATAQPPAASLPFVPASASAGPALAAQRTAPARPPAPSRGNTVALPSGADGAPPRPAGVPDLTLPQYASLRVDLQQSPDRADDILARYGTSRAGRAALDDHWRARFEADPLLRMMFAKAYATYISWLRERAGS